MAPAVAAQSSGDRQIEPSGVSADPAAALSTSNQTLITGQVNYPNGTGASDEMITMDVVDDSVHNVTWTNSTGHFSETTVPNETVDIGFSQVAGSGSWEQTYPADGVPDIYALDRVDTSSDVTLPTRTLPTAHNLTVEVVDGDGNPVQGARVNVGHQNNNAQQWTSNETNASGEFRLEVVGTTDVYVEPPQNSSLDDNGTRIEVTADRTLRMVLRETVTVSGNVSEAGGSAAANDQLHFMSQNSRKHPITESDGSYTAQLVPSETYGVYYEQDDPTTDADVAYPKDGTVDVYTFGTESYSDNTTGVDRQLPVGHVLNVTVVNTSDVPIEDARVNVRVPNGDYGWNVRANTTGTGLMVHPESDAPGFEVNGTVQVNVRKPGYNRSYQELTVNSDRELELTLTEVVTVSGNVSEADGSAAANDQLHFMSQNSRKHPITESDGSYTARLLPGETYGVYYEQDDPTTNADVAYPKDGTVDLYAFGNESYSNDTTGVDRQLPVGHVLNVTVTNTTGVPIEDARVKVRVPNGDYGWSVRANTTGTGLMVHPESDAPGLEVNGSVVVNVRKPGYNRSHHTLTVTEDRELRVTLEERVTVTGRFIDEDGKPLVNDQVAANGPNTWAVRSSDDNGDWSVDIPEDTVEFVFVQRNDSTGDYLPRDGTTDIYRVDKRSIENDTDYGTVTIPDGHVVNVTVVDESGNPVENASVDIYPDSDADGTLFHMNTDENGMLNTSQSHSTPPGIELVGDVSINVSRPPARAAEDDHWRFVDKTYWRNITVTGKRNLTVTLEETNNVSGQIVDSSDQALANATIVADGPDTFETTRTNGTGNLSMTFGDDDAVRFTVGQREPSTGDLFPRDGTVDLYDLDTRNVSTDTNLGTVTVPDGYVVNLTVINESGDPVEDARVAIYPRHSEQGAAYGASTRTDGMIAPSADGLAGVELVGNATFEVEPPDNSTAYVDKTYYKNVTVSSDRDLTVTLDEKGSTPVNVTQQWGTTTSDRNKNTSRQVTIRPDKNLTIDNGTNYEFVFSNDDDFTNSVTLAVDGGFSLNNTESLAFMLYDGDGTARSPSDARFWHLERPNATFYNVSVVSGTIPQASGTTNFTVTLRNASNGNVINDTASKASVVGYTGVASQNSTTGDVRISVPRDVVPERSSVALQLTNATGHTYQFSMSYDSASDEFASVVNASNYQDGEFDWRVLYELDGWNILQVSQHATQSGNITLGQTQNVSLYQKIGSKSITGENTTRHVKLATDTNVTFDNGSNYHVVYTNDDTGNSVTLEIDGTFTVLKNTNTFGFKFYNANGDVRKTSLQRITHYNASGATNYDFRVVSGAIPQANGTTNFTVTLKNATNGDVVAQTESKASVVGYRGVVTQNSTTGMVQLSVPRDAVPERTDVTVELVNASGSTSRVPMSYDAGTDTFQTVVDASNYADGEYTWKTEYDLDGWRILTVPGRATSGDNVTLGDTTTETISQCGEITQSGTYELTQDISGSGFETSCLLVSASNVTIDGQGHTVTATDYYGIYVFANNSDSKDVTIRNVTVRDANVGVKFQSQAGVSADDGTVRNVTITATSNHGLELRSVNRTTVVDSNVTDAGAYKALFLTNTADTLVQDTDIGSDGWDMTGRTSRNITARNLTVDGDATLWFEAKNVKIRNETVPAAPSATDQVTTGFNATNTSASAYLAVSMKYTDAQASGVDESTIAFYSHDGSWTQVFSSTVDTSTNVVSANVTSFSDFAAFGDHADTSGSWTFATDSRLQYAQVAAGSDLVYASGLGTDVYALYRTNGTVAWSVQRTGSLVDSAPALHNGTVFVGSGSGTVYALNASTGATEWTYGTDSAVVSSPTVDNGTVYVGSNDGTVVALDEDSGSEIWTYEAGDAVFSEPAVGSGSVFVTTDAGVLVALDRATGGQQWTHDTGVELGHSSPAVDGDTVYVAADTVQALDADTGSLTWETSYGGTAGASPAVVDGSVYVGAANATVAALDAGTGAVEWQFAADDTVSTTPAVSGDRAIAATTTGTVYVLNATSGTALNQTTVDDTVRTPLTVAGDNLYLGTRNGTVVSIDNGSSSSSLSTTSSTTTTDSTDSTTERTTDSTDSTDSTTERTTDSTDSTTDATADTTSEGTDEATAADSEAVTATPTAEPTTPTEDSTDAPSETEASTADAASDTSGDDTATEVAAESEQEATTTSQPIATTTVGFGVLVAVFALLAGGALVLRRRNS